MRLVLDEHLARAVAEQLRRRGHDVTAVVEDPGLVGTSDAELFAWSTETGRAIVTYDVRGFRPLAEERQASGEAFPGVVFLSASSHPQGERRLGAIVRDLAALLEALPGDDALAGRWVYLASSGRLGARS